MKERNKKRSNVSRKRKHGFLARMLKKWSRKVINKRRSKGRKRLVVTISKRINSRNGLVRAY